MRLVKACRSCGAPVVWLTMRPSGKAMPVDDAPHPDGNILADLDQAVGIVLSPPMRAELIDHGAPEPLYRSHFVTCPQADDWRRDRRGRL